MKSLEHNRDIHSINRNIKEKELRFRFWLSRYSILDLFKVVWDASFLQSQFTQDLAAQSIRLKNHPKGFSDAKSIHEKLHLHPWKLEHILNAKLATEGPSIFRPSLIDPFDWNNFRELYNAAYEYTNAYDELRLGNQILGKMVALGHQQFPFQNSYSFRSIYRAHKLTSGQKTRNFFENTFSTTLEHIFESLLFGYNVGAISGALHKSEVDDFAHRMGLNNAFDILQIYCHSIQAAAFKSRIIRNKNLLGEMQPSVLRESPFVGINDNLIILPLPCLVPISLGDSFHIGFNSLPDDVFNDIGKSFESYIKELLSDAFPNVIVTQDQNYGTRKRPKLTPDLRIYIDGVLSSIIECKSHRISFGKKFNRKSADDFDPRIFKVAEGCVQIWRYVLHLRTENNLNEEIDNDLTGYVAMLESWHSLEGNFRKTVLGHAHKTADLEGIPIDDRIDIAFVSVAELEEEIWSMNLKNFIELPKINSRKKYEDWMPSSILRSKDVVREKHRGDPVIAKLNKALPKWGAMDKTHHKKK